VTADPLTLVDWRRLDADRVVPLLEAEMATWDRDLHWDVHQSWAAIEPARVEGRLPGVALIDRDGAPRAWACYLRHRDALQVALLVAESPSETRQLVDAIAASPEAAGTAIHVLFTRDAAPGLPAALASRGFSTAYYRYRICRAAVFPQEPLPEARDWRPGDELAMADLCGRAYDQASGLRAFAPRGTAEEWHDYIGTLVNGTSCGRFLPACSFVVPSGTPGRIDGAVLVTRLRTGVAHIAQIAVDPDRRRRHVGRRLLARASACARACGHDVLTLLVAERNTAAVALYDRLGFEEAGRFVAAVNNQPRRSTSVALDTGGASTRR
jgi:ribosomal-protein-alanine N-acetyltransferase